ncbi:hypothetical protein KP79_PYT05761 [Mizuhopecten yessoensis]|uniref:Uncharacterized protein n=1 Tax=Mizuhopecten yessoensis TaxID=6573 RepID=A0A210QM98_MIZYE|nr:hypothetical protein KP79_PYT05761 [Mizuhopecten yessoensis]
MFTAIIVYSLNDNSLVSSTRFRLHSLLVPQRTQQQYHGRCVKAREKQQGIKGQGFQGHRDISTQGIQGHLDISAQGIQGHLDLRYPRPPRHKVSKATSTQGIQEQLDASKPDNTWMHQHKLSRYKDNSRHFQGYKDNLRHFQGNKVVKLLPALI